MRHARLFYAGMAGAIVAILAIVAEVTVGADTAAYQLAGFFVLVVSMLGMGFRDWLNRRGWELSELLEELGE